MCFSLEIHTDGLSYISKCYSSCSLLSIVWRDVRCMLCLIQPLTSPLQPTFLVELSKVLANPGNTQVARVAAGLQVKNSLTSKDPDVKAQYQQRWLAIDANARREIKNYVRKPVMLTQCIQRCCVPVCASHFCTYLLGNKAPKQT